MAPPKWQRMRRVDLKEQGRRVRAARAYLGVNADTLASTIGIGKSTLLKIERGQRDAKPMELWAIAEVCGVPREFFESERLEIEALEGIEADAIVDEADDQEEQRNGEQAAEADQ